MTAAPVLPPLPLRPHLNHKPTAPEPGPRLYHPVDDGPVIDAPASNPWGEEADVAGTHSLQLYFVEYVRPELRTASNVDERDRAVKRWVEFCRLFPISPTLPHCVDNDRTIHPVLASITSKSLAAFQAYLTKTGVPNRANNKAVAGVRACLSHATKRGFLGKVPGVKLLPTNTAATIYTLTHAEFSQAWHAADVADWPRYRRATASRPGRWPLPYSPADGWRALLVLLATYGMRTEDAVAYSPDASPLLWGDIRREPRNPHPAGKLSNPWGWLVFVPDKTKAKKPEPLVLPLTQLVRYHLDRLDPHGAARPEDPLFDWPWTSGAGAKAKYGFYATFRRIFAAAGVHARDWSGDPVEYTPAHLRKTCVTWHETHVPGSSQWITGHASERSPDATLTAVQRRHYFNAEALVLNALTRCPILGGWALQQ